MLVPLQSKLKVYSFSLTESLEVKTMKSGTSNQILIFSKEPGARPLEVFLIVGNNWIIRYFHFTMCSLTTALFKASHLIFIPFPCILLSAITDVSRTGSQALK